MGECRVSWRLYKDCERISCYEGGRELFRLVFRCVVPVVPLMLQVPRYVVCNYIIIVG